MGGKEGMEENLRDLGHARDGFSRQMAEMSLRPGGLVGCGEGGTVGGDAPPVTEQGVPDGDVTDLGVCGADSGDAVFEAGGEAGGFSFEVFPAALELGGGGLSPVKRLPIVVDDEGGNMYIVCNEGV